MYNYNLHIILLKCGIFNFQIMKRGDLKDKLMRLGGIAFLVYIFFLAGKTVYQNVKYNGVEKDLQQEVDVLDTENTNLKNKILYYKTDSYKEMVMRERLGYQKPGEHVLAITVPKQGEQQSKTSKKQQEVSNFQKWKNFLFPKKQED